MITKRQFQVIKTKIIWMRGYPRPDGPYVRWWDQQDPFTMEKLAQGMRVDQASRLIAAAVKGEWQTVIALWRQYTG
jgi:hypothetical protein